MKKVIKTMVVAAVFGTFASTAMAASFANLGASSVKYNKLPVGVTLYQNNPQALFANGKTVQADLESFGILGASVYTANIKNENAMNYGVVGDIAIGKTALSTMGIQSTSSEGSKKEELRSIAAFLNSNDNNSAHPYTVVSPLTADENIYVGTFMLNSTGANMNYGEILHVILFDDKYGGPSLRVLALDSESNATIWPKMDELMKLKAK